MVRVELAWLLRSILRRIALALYACILVQAILRT